MRKAKQSLRPIIFEQEQSMAPLGLFTGTPLCCLLVFTSAALGSKHSFTRSSSESHSTSSSASTASTADSSPGEEPYPLAPPAGEHAHIESEAPSLIYGYGESARHSSSAKRIGKPAMPPILGLKTFGLGALLAGILLVTALIREYDPVTKEEYSMTHMLAKFNRNINQALPAEKRLNSVSALTIVSVFLTIAGLGELIRSAFRRYKAKKAGGVLKPPPLRGILLLLSAGIVLLFAATIKRDPAVSSTRVANTAGAVAAATGVIGLLQLVGSLLAKYKFSKQGRAPGTTEAEMSGVDIPLEDPTAGRAEDPLPSSSGIQPLRPEMNIKPNSSTADESLDSVATYMDGGNCREKEDFSGEPPIGGEENKQLKESFGPDEDHGTTHQ